MYTTYHSYNTFLYTTDHSYRPTYTFLCNSYMHYNLITFRNSKKYTITKGEYPYIIKEP